VLGSAFVKSVLETINVNSRRSSVTGLLPFIILGPYGGLTTVYFLNVRVEDSTWSQEFARIFVNRDVVSFSFEGALKDTYDSHRDFFMGDAGSVMAAVEEIEGRVRLEVRLGWGMMNMIAGPLVVRLTVGDDRVFAHFIRCSLGDCDGRFDCACFFEDGDVEGFLDDVIGLLIGASGDYAGF